jgi:hypothetical protein
MAASNVTPCGPLTQRASCCRATTHSALSSQRWSISPACRHSEDGEVEVIVDKPGNTVEDRNRPRLLCRRAKESHSLGKYRAVGSLPVCPSMKLVGKPGAGIGTPGLMSGDGKRGVAEWPKLPRPSSTLPHATCRDEALRSACGGNPDIGQTSPNDPRPIAANRRHTLL